MTTKFVDGSARLAVLELSRAPFFLRVVRGLKDGDKWDALDLLDDEPAADEEVYCYFKVSFDGSMHLDYTDKATGKRKGRNILSATYQLWPMQPTEAIMRHNPSWVVWCQNNYPKTESAV